MNIDKVGFTKSGGNKDTLYTAVFFVLFIFITIVIFIKCSYGYTHFDEGFYPTIAARFLQGDRILVDEWNVTSLSGIVLMPVLKIFKLLNGDYTGIYLFIRYVYTALKVLLSLYIFHVFKKHDRKAAMVASLLFLTFARYGLMVLSYNSVGSGTFLLSLIILFDEDIRKNRFKEILSKVLSGIILSVSVLCNPYFAGLYIIYFVIAVLLELRSVRRHLPKPAAPFNIGSFLNITIGVFISVVAFFTYVLSKSSPGQILNALPYILNGDPEHRVKSFYYMTAGYFARILVGNDRNFISFAVYIVMFFVAMIYILIKNKERFRRFYLISETVLSIILVFVYLISDCVIDHIIFVPNVLALLLVIAVKDDLLKRIFICLYLPGMLATYFSYLASNTGFSCISSSSCVAAVGSAFIITHVIRHLTEKEIRSGRWFGFFLSSFLTIIFISVLFLRITNTFWEKGLDTLNKKIDFGPCKGLIVSENSFEYYNGVYEDTKEIRELTSQENVIYISDMSLWMSGNHRCAAYSTWCMSITYTDLLYDYYADYPYKKAKYVYIDKVYGGKSAEYIADRLGMSIEEKKYGWILKDVQ